MAGFDPEPEERVVPHPAAGAEMHSRCAHANAAHVVFNDAELLSFGDAAPAVQAEELRDNAECGPAPHQMPSAS